MDFVKKYWHGVLIVIAAIAPLVQPMDPKIYAAIVAALGVYEIVIQARDSSA